METNDIRSLDCPWPGPVPYSEGDAERFLGRTREVKLLLNRLDRQQLNVLIALSGVGKSSLLQAGLIPALRYIREDTKEVGPALLVREWAGLSESSPSGLLIHAISNSIRRLAEQGAASGGEQFRQDIEVLSKVPFLSAEAVKREPESALRALVDYVRRLCSATGSLILIIDQAEELLGSGLPGPDQDLERGVLRMIGTLFAKEKRLTLLISLREEYLGRISLLGKEVDGLDGRIFRLEPMPQATVREVLLQTPSLTDDRVTFEGERVVDTLLRWLGQLSDASATGADSQDSVDLLRLQALLTEVFREAQQKSSGTGIVINEETLSEFKRQLERKLGREVSPKELARHALENYVERLLQEARVSAPPVGPGRKLMKRILVRMAPWLSSPGGFKRHVPENELVVNAIRDDLEILGLKSRPDEVRSAVACIFQKWRPSESRVHVDECNLSDDSTESQDPQGLTIEFEASDDSYLSGDALLQGWSPHVAATMLARAAFEVLRLLCANSVLKSSQGSTFTYELVHDGFGPALFEWAERERSTLLDTLASIVSRRGETFRWRTIDGDILRRVSWLGCNINDTIIKKVRFENCILTGTIATECTLENCVFEDCDLRGAVFVGGSWKDVDIRACKCHSALFLGAKWDGVRIESSILENATLTGLGLSGNVEINDCSLVFSQILKFKTLNGQAGGITISNSDLQNALLEERRAVLDEECNENGVLRKKSEAVAPKRGRLAVRG